MMVDRFDTPVQVFRITKNTSGYVRTALCIEDIAIESKEVLIGFNLLSVMTIEDENIFLFTGSYRVPYFDLFYASRVRGLQDRYLPELLKRLLYLNPKPDRLLRRKIVELVLNRFTVRRDIESEVLVGKTASVPLLSFDQVSGALVGVIGSRIIDGYVPDTERYLMYSRESKLTRGQKIRLSLSIRSAVTLSHYGKAIHNAAEYLMELNDMVQINYTRIRNTNLVLKDENQATVATISRYMTERTKRMVDEVNTLKPFKRLERENKYREFLELPNMSLRGYAGKLNLSKSTIIEFKNIRQLSNE